MRWSRVIGVCLLLCAIAVPVRAQDEEVRTIPFDGPEVFCHILNETGLKPIVRLERIDPRNTMIVIFGHRTQRKLDEIRRVTGGIDHFLADGGSLLIATDYHLGAPDLPIRITGNRVQCFGDFAFEGQEDCPKLTYPAESVSHPLFRFLQQGIATNCPSEVLLLPKAPVQRLLKYPLDLDQVLKDLVRGKDNVFGMDTYMAGSTSDAPPEGRALYIAGHGMFMNGMMLQTKTDNFAFAVNTVQWLREGPDGRLRERALFIVDGEIIANFDADLSPRLPPVPLPTIRKIDRALHLLDNEGVIPRFLAENLDHQRTAAVFFAFATFALLIYAAKKFMEGRHLPETAAPLTVGPHAAGGGEPIVRQRLDALIRKNHLTEAARSLVYEWLHDQAATTSRHCELLAEASASSLLRSQVDFVMRLVRSDKPMRVTRTQFRELVESLPRLSQAVREKQVSLFVAGKNVRQLPASCPV